MHILDGFTGSELVSLEFWTLISRYFMFGSSYRVTPSSASEHSMVCFLLPSVDYLMRRPPPPTCLPPRRESFLYTMALGPTVSLSLMTTAAPPPTIVPTAPHNHLYSQEPHRSIPAIATPNPRNPNSTLGVVTIAA
jgi:hypothetical protein